MKKMIRSLKSVNCICILLDSMLCVYSIVYLFMGTNLLSMLQQLYTVSLLCVYIYVFMGASLLSIL